MPRYTAVLDACVLVPIALADTLLRVAEKGLYRPLWSGRILAEDALRPQRPVEIFLRDAQQRVGQCDRQEHAGVEYCRVVRHD